MGQAFISHAKEDKKVALELHHDLKERGGKPWLDRINLIAGEDWRPSIEKAIGDSMHVIVLMSEHSLVRGKWREVQREIRYALRRRREKYSKKTYVIPVRLDSTEGVGTTAYVSLTAHRIAESTTE